MTRTYGVYDFRPGVGSTRGIWGLRVEPNVAIRAKRIFTRVRDDRSGELVITDADDVARDLEWLMERFPLRPFRPEAEERLRAGAAEHRETMAAVARVTEGRGHRLHLPMQPLKRNQAEPITTRDGQLRTDATTDTTRARALAEQVLGIRRPTEGNPS